MSKALVCTCEDVTADDVQAALDRGYCDMESVKRYTGFGTGMCQGRACEAQVARLLAQSGKLRPGGIRPFTPRPPLVPTELSVLARAPLDPTQRPAGGVPASLGLSPPELRPADRLPPKAKVVIVGGGIMGLALAHNLALRGEKDVLVLERSYLCAGASGRNGGGVRMQWGTSTNIELAKRSMELMKRFAGEMGFNVWLRQGGYLFLAESKPTAARLEHGAALHARHGLKTRLMTPDAARELVPELSLKDVVLCAYNPDDGVVFPWPFLWGYAQSCQRAGIRVETFTDVTGFAVGSGRVQAVKTPRGDVACETVVVACGAWSPKVSALADVRLPNEPHRHEICSTEPLKPFLGPLVSVLDSGLYFSQSMRGEIVGGMGDPDEPPGLNMGSSLRFLTRYARALTAHLPIAGKVRVLRQWAGCYDLTPDNSPILGRTPSLPNMLQMSGFVGAGFMMAPAVAERMAAWMGGEKDELFTRFSLERFDKGQPVTEREEMIIG